MDVHLEFDKAVAKKFEQSLIDSLNKSALALMISLGHRTHLFDKMAPLGYETAHEIALLSGLNERYVKEWLGAMVTGKIIDYDASSDRYHLPAEHAAFLCRSAGPDNFAAMMQYISIMGGAEEQVLNAFKTGKGVGYEHFHRFHAVMAEESEQTVLSFLDTSIIPLIPELEGKLKSGIHVLDVGCGSGKVINHLAMEYPNSQFYGVDFSEEALNNARKEMFENDISNVHYELRDLSDFDESAPSDTYDLVLAFDTIHDQGQPLNVLKGIHRSLKINGVLLMQDIGGTSFLEQDKKLPYAPFLYSLSTFHCMSVSLAQPHGEGLGAMWGEAMTRQYLHIAGFSRIETHKLPHDAMNNWYVIHR